MNLNSINLHPTNEKSTLESEAFDKNQKWVSDRSSATNLESDINRPLEIGFEGQVDTNKPTQPGAIRPRQIKLHLRDNQVLTLNVPEDPLDRSNAKPLHLTEVRELIAWTCDAMKKEERERRSKMALKRREMEGKGLVRQSAMTS